MQSVASALYQLSYRGPNQYYKRQCFKTRLLVVSALRGLYRFRQFRRKLIENEFSIYLSSVKICASDYTLLAAVGTAWPLLV